MDIYISGLVPEIGEASLMKLFSAVGKVDSLRLIRDRLSGEGPVDPVLVREDQ